MQWIRDCPTLEHAKLITDALLVPNPWQREKDHLGEIDSESESEL